MDLPLDMKQQLMQMAGIKDVKEFDEMAEKIAGTATNTIKKASTSRQSPFQGKNIIYIFIHKPRKSKFLT